MTNVAPLDGLTVIEVASWIAAPSAAALMADMGARVIKVEPPEGDGLRYVAYQPQVEGDRARTNYAFQLDNRGKRSLALDLEKPGAAAVVLRLCAGADVFVCNLTPARQERFGLTPAALLAVNPRLVYAALTGYGLRGPDAERDAMDNTAFAARSGLALLSGEADAPVSRIRGGQGDHTAALNLLAAVLLALRMRDADGRGRVVDVSLFATGIWTIGQDFSAALVDERQPPRGERRSPPNPLSNSYRCRDGGWLVFTMAKADLYWPAFCRAIGRERIIDDPRFATFAARRENSRELTAMIEEAFAREDQAYWRPRLDAAGLVWAPAASLPEVVRDGQAEATGIFAEIEHPLVGTFRTVAAPFRIEGADVRPRGPAPEIGQHTAEVLGDFGFSDAAVADLAARGLFG
jgi:crotonobetainyl-CoA:carnitine CoA-transferase CaiB-like acyl-CoA transferase